MTITPAEDFAHVRVALSANDADPLSHWHFAVPRLKAAFRLFTAEQEIDELHLRGPNKGTKTETMVAWILECAKKANELDGVPIPRWDGPVECAQLVLDYTQQLLSVQPAYLRLLGRWPHHARYHGEILTSLRVKPIGGDDDESRWSVIHFLSEKNVTAGTGVRGDVIGFDEPPVMPILRELRKAAHAGRRCVTVIAETPTIRSQWAPLKEDYGECPRRSIRRVDQERAEVRWSLDEVADWVLSPAEKAKLRRKYATDPLERGERKARTEGDYTNAEGTCPLDVEVLLEMLECCREPDLIECRVSHERDDDGEGTVIERVPVEVFGRAAKGEPCYLDIDPASGTDDGRHHQAGLHLSSMATGDLLVRWAGYLPPFSLGRLAAGLGRRYNDAAIDIEMKDHWGVNVLRGIQSAQYPGTICHETRETRPGQFSKEVGFDNNEYVRSVIVGCVQEWTASWRAGRKFAACPSRAVINGLLDCELDLRGKVIAGPDLSHGLDLILLGQKLRKLGVRVGNEVPELYRPPRSADERIAALIRGEESDDGGDAPWDGLLIPRESWRP